jgi:hypothetical protein
LIARKFEKSPRGETATFSGRSRKGQAAAKGPPFRRFLQTRALIGVRPRRGEARNKRNQLLTQIMGKHALNTAKYNVDVETLIQFGI